MNLRVVEWNVAGHKGKYGMECTEKYYDCIKKECASLDVLILTEYNQNKNDNNGFENKLKEKYFFVKNKDVLIALNKETWISIEEIKNIGDFSSNICVAMGTLKEGEKKIMIIGMRICIPGVKLESEEEKEEDYINRYEQLLQLKNIKITTPVILAGDFNNSRFFGEMNDLKYDEYDGLLTHHYNLQKIKAFFYNLGFEYYKSTPFGNVATEYSFKNRYTYKIDHIFVKDIKVESVFYSHDQYKSDHRMLISDVRVDVK